MAKLKGQEIFMIEKGLTRKDAMAKTRKRIKKKDHRGFTYNSKTGRACWT